MKGRLQLLDSSFLDFWIRAVFSQFVYSWLVNSNTYSENVRKTMTLVRLTFTFSLPTLATLVLYIKVAWQLSEYKTLQQEFLVQNAELLKKNKTVKISFLIVWCSFSNFLILQIITKILLLAFTHFLCWFPLSVVESLNDLFPSLFHRCDTDIHHYFYYRIKSILILITSLSGVIYPILYCFVSSQFKVWPFLSFSDCENLFFCRKSWLKLGFTPISVTGHAAIDVPRTYHRWASKGAARTITMIFNQSTTIWLPTSMLRCPRLWRTSALMLVNLNWVWTKQTRFSFLVQDAENSIATNDLTLVHARHAWWDLMNSTLHTFVISV